MRDNKEITTIFDPRRTGTLGSSGGPSSSSSGHRGGRPAPPSVVIVTAPPPDNSPTGAGGGGEGDAVVANGPSPSPQVLAPPPAHHHHHHQPSAPPGGLHPPPAASCTAPSSSSVGGGGGGGCNNSHPPGCDPHQQSCGGGQSGGQQDGGGGRRASALQSLRNFRKSCCSRSARKMYCGVCVTVCVTASWVGATHSIKYLYHLGPSSSASEPLPEHRVGGEDPLGALGPPYASSDGLLSLGPSSPPHGGDDPSTRLLPHPAKLMPAYDAPFFTTWFCTNWTILFFPIYAIGRFLASPCHSKQQQTSRDDGQQQQQTMEQQQQATTTAQGPSSAPGAPVPSTGCCGGCRRGAGRGERRSRCCCSRCCCFCRRRRRRRRRGGSGGGRGGDGGGLGAAERGGGGGGGGASSDADSSSGSSSSSSSSEEQDEEGGQRRRRRRRRHRDGMMDGMEEGEEEEDEGNGRSSSPSSSGGGSSPERGAGRRGRGPGGGGRRRRRKRRRRRRNDDEDGGGATPSPSAADGAPTAPSAAVAHHRPSSCCCLPCRTRRPAAHHQQHHQHHHHHHHHHHRHKGRQCCDLLGDTMQRFRDKGFTPARFLTRCCLFCLLWVGYNYMYVHSLRILFSTDAMALYATHACCVYLLSWVLLHHQFVGVRIVAVITVDTGIALLAYMDGITGSPTLGGVVLAACAAAGSAVYKVLFKKVMGEASMGQVALFFSIVGLLNALLLWPLLLALYLLGAETFLWNDLPWLELLLAGGLSLLANLFSSFSVAVTYDLFITLGFITAVPVSAALDVVLYGAHFAGMKLAGIVLISVGFFLVMFPDNWPDYITRLLRNVILLSHSARWSRRQRHGATVGQRRDVIDYRTGYIRSHLRSPSGRVR